MLRRSGCLILLTQSGLVSQVLLHDRNLFRDRAIGRSSGRLPRRRRGRARSSVCLRGALARGFEGIERRVSAGVGVVLTDDGR